MDTSNLKKTPLNEWHRSAGARMTHFGGWDMPVQYEVGIIKEHLATRRHAGLFDVSHMGRFFIRGSDTIAFLQHVLTNNVEALEPWQAQYTLIPNERGGVVDDAYLYRFGEEDFLLVVNAANREKDWHHLQEQAQSFADLVLEDHTEMLAMIAFQGPLSARVLSRLLEKGELPEPVRNSLSRASLCGISTLVARTGYTGEPIGFELFVPPEQVEKLWSRVHEESAERGGLPVGLGARDTLRLEAGLPLYGHEYGVDAEGKEIPALAFPLARVAVSFSRRKGAFVGREALARQFEVLRALRTGTYRKTDILPRRFRAVALLERGVARQGHEVFIEERKVGVVTSGTVTPYWKFEGEGAMMRITNESTNRAIAIAYLDAELPPEQYVDVVVRGRRIKAQIVRFHGRSDAPPYFRPIPADWEKPRPNPAVGLGLEKAEVLLKRTVRNHEWRQRLCINLIPSEMTPSSLVRLVQVTDPLGRYAEHKRLLAAFDREVYYYQGTDFIKWVEERVIAEMSDYLGCPLIEPRTISGQMANVTVFSGFVDYRNRLDRRREPERIRLAMNHHIGRGGHLSSQPMGALGDYVARDPVTEKYAVVNFPARRDNPYQVDIEATAELLDRVDPELVIFGKSMVLHPEPIGAFKKLVEERGKRPIILYDMAHVLGLVGPHFQEPFKEGADIVTGSTHKTFFGTQRGVIGSCFVENTPEYDLWNAIRRRAFPGMLSNHHLGSLLGLLFAAIEMNAFKNEYQPQVISNAKAFARALKEQGMEVEGDPAVGYTETHQVIVRVGYARGCEVAQRLEENNIITNYQAIPGDESFMASSGLRLGVAEMTRFGMKEEDFAAFAELFAEAVRGKTGIAEKVAAFRESFLGMQYCFDEEMLAPLKRELLKAF